MSGRKAVVLTAGGAKTKGELHERLSEPPEELLQLGLSNLEALRDALALANLATST